MLFLIFDEQDKPCAMYDASAADMDRYVSAGKVFRHAEFDGSFEPGDAVIVEDETSSTGYRAEAAE